MELGSHPQYLKSNQDELINDGRNVLLWGLPRSTALIELEDVFRNLEVGWIRQRLFTRVAKIRHTVYV